MSEDDKTHLAGQAEQAPGKPPAALQITPGTVLKGTYRVEAELGSGGMGTVYRATHIGLDKTMALKVLSPRAVATPDSLARFEREAKVAGKVSHPAMTQVIDFGVEQGTPYIVMEYVAGVELADLIERNGPMPPRRAVAVMRQIVSLLRAAHALGIVHRDLKPANVKVLHDETDESQLFVKVLDFGVAKVVGDISGQLTSEGMLVGTPAYMAPEQISGKPIDGRTDLYSAGLIFHEMLSGTRAFRGETIARLLMAQMNDPPPALTVPVPDIVRQTLQKFYEKRPEDRFQDAAEADRALMACEDVLRPPSANIAVASVRPAAGGSVAPVGVAHGLEDAGSNHARTLTLNPQKAVEAPGAAGQPEPEPATAKPSSSVAVAPSLVTPRPAPEQPPLVSTPVASEPVRVPGPSAPVPASLQAVPSARSSGSGKILAVLGVAVMLLLAGLGGIAWAWKSGRFSSLIPGAPAPDTGTVAVQPPSTPATPEPAPPTAPAQPEPTPSEPVPAPTEVAAADTPPQPAEPTEATEAVGTPPTDDASENQGAGEQAESGEQPEVAGTPAPPPVEELAAGCYSVVVAFESNRLPGGKYTPWMPASVDSRKPIKCSAIPNRGTINNAQGLYDHWPNAPEELLSASSISFQAQKKGAPDTRRMVVRAYTRVSEGAP
jgi:serine/threonine protein kinase